MEKEKIEGKERKEEHGDDLDEEDGLRDMIGAYLGQMREVVISWVGMGVLGEKDGQRGSKQKEKEKEEVELPASNIILLYDEASPPEKPRCE